MFGLAHAGITWQHSGIVTLSVQKSGCGKNGMIIMILIHRGFYLDMQYILRISPASQIDAWGIHTCKGTLVSSRQCYALSEA